MKKYKFNVGAITLKVGIAVLINSILDMPTLYALPAPISFDVRDRNGIIGKVSIKGDNYPGSLDEGLTGGFEVTRKNASGATMTIKELENSLGGVRFNWFQMVTSIEKD